MEEYKEQIAIIRDVFKEQTPFSTIVNGWIDLMEEKVEAAPEESRQALATHHLDEFYTLMRKKREETIDSERK